MGEAAGAEPNGEGGLLKRAVTVIAFALGCFHLLNVSGLLVLSTREIRIVHLMLMLVLLFLTVPASKRFAASGADKTARIVLALASLGCGLYLLSRWLDIALTGGDTVPMDTLVGGIFMLLVLEASRRGVGLALALITTVFFAYPFYCDYLPGVLHSRGYGFARISEYLTASSQGLFGVPIGVSSTYIILFAIYGAFLSEFGAGDFFFRLASRLTKGMRAAGAKTAVIFSTLLGMISGSAAGNVAVTGTLTIPMMKREGYASHQAGAVEAVVSTGGQMMPPVMGAAAFIMAEIIGVSYSSVMTAALIPAVLFFISMLFVVHLQAKKSGIEPIQQPENDDEPLWSILLKGGQYIISFAALIAMMMNGYSPFRASFISIIVLIACHIIWTRRIGLDIAVKSARAITEGTISVIPIAIACAAAGVIAGILGVTGLGSKIAGLIVDGSGGIVLLALIFTMFAAIILGMGLPTTAAYLILATVVAPALARMGVPIMTAHMFVFFFGCLSTITPPVALASYVAAGIAGTDINKVGWTAFGYGISCFILPFMFYYGPALMMQGPVVEVIVAFLSGIAGVGCIAAATVGYLRGALPPVARLGLAIAGICLLEAGWISNGAGLLILGFIWFTSRPSLEPAKTRQTD